LSINGCMTFRATATNGRKLPAPKTGLHNQGEDLPHADKPDF